jgi:very-short-patch-repair endonuclease
MRRNGEELATERALAAIAARQHGVVTTAQLADAGVGRNGASRRVADGRLRRLHRGVFLLGPLTGRWTREMAAVLACGVTAVLSHRSAAGLWRIRHVWLGPPEVTVTDGRSRGRPGIEVTRSCLPAAETRWREGIRVTSPARTLLDLAAVTDQRELARALNEAQVLRLVTPRELAEVTGRGRPGAKALRAALQAQFEPRFTRSEAEAAFLDLIRDAGYPAPEANVRILGVEVDFLWRAEKLVVEVDGFAFHSSRQAFERDRRRDARLQAAGFRVVRFTYRQIVDEPALIHKCLDMHITSR